VLHEMEYPASWILAGYLSSDDPLKLTLPEDPGLMDRIRAIPGGNCGRSSARRMQLHQRCGINPAPIMADSQQLLLLRGKIQRNALRHRG
jgi:hypothetical protein